MLAQNNVLCIIHGQNRVALQSNLLKGIWNLGCQLLSPLHKLVNWELDELINIYVVYNHSLYIYFLQSSSAQNVELLVLRLLDPGQDSLSKYIQSFCLNEQYSLFRLIQKVLWVWSQNFVNPEEEFLNKDVARVGRGICGQYLSNRVKTTQNGKHPSSWPLRRIVFQTSNEVNQIDFSKSSQFVNIEKVNNEVFLHWQVVWIDKSIDLFIGLNSRVHNFCNRISKVFPRNHSPTIFLLQSISKENYNAGWNEPVLCHFFGNLLKSRHRNCALHSFQRNWLLYLYF